MQELIHKKSIIFGITLVLLAGLVGACSGRASGSSSNMAPGADNGVATTVNVVTSEMSFALDPLPTQAGKITFIVTNNGKIEHDFVVKGNGVQAGTKMIPPGGSETITLTLAPGTYEFVCAVFGHSFAGMQGNFTLN